MREINSLVDLFFPLVNLAPGRLQAMAEELQVLLQGQIRGRSLRLYLRGTLGRLQEADLTSLFYPVQILQAELTTRIGAFLQTVLGNSYVARLLHTLVRDEVIEVVESSQQEGSLLLEIEILRLEPEPSRTRSSLTYRTGRISEGRAL